MGSIARWLGSTKAIGTLASLVGMLALLVAACGESPREPQRADLVGLWDRVDDRGDGWQRHAFLRVQADGTWTLRFRAPNDPRTAYVEGDGKGEWRLRRREGEWTLELTPGAINGLSDWDGYAPAWWIRRREGGGWVLRDAGNEDRVYVKAE